MNDSTEKIIDALASDTGSLKPAPSLLVRIGLWSISLILVAAVGVFLLGLRGDIGELLSSPRFLLESLALFLLALSAGSMALVLSVPGVKHSKTKTFLCAAGALWLACFAALFFIQSQRGTLMPIESIFQPGFHCAKTMVGLTVVPALALVGLVRLGAPLGCRLAGVFSLGASALLAALTLQFTCAKDGFFHLLYHHYIPVLVLGLLGALVGSWFLDFNTRLRKLRSKLELSND